MARARPIAQLPLVLRTWGGARRGAGRKSAAGKPRLGHVTREEFSRRMPVHVTLRMLPHVWNLRSQRSFRILHDALERMSARGDCAVMHYAVQGNHVHLVVEADSSRALGRGMRALTIQLARGLNAMMERRGRVFEDRYHAHVLRSPAEARNAVGYVLNNHASHARRRGEPLVDGFVDPYSSSSAAAPRVGQLALWGAAPTTSPRTWLLRRCVS